jgi:hypothetical protein
MSLSHIPIKFETLFRYLKWVGSQLKERLQLNHPQVLPSEDVYTHDDEPQIIEYVMRGGDFYATDVIDYYDYEEQSRHRAGARLRWFSRESRVHPF